MPTTDICNSSQAWPRLPSKTDKLPSGSQWLHEIKHDGFRVIAGKNESRVKLDFLAERQAALDLWKAHVGRVLTGISQERRIALKTSHDRPTAERMRNGNERAPMG